MIDRARDRSAWDVRIAQRRLPATATMLMSAFDRKPAWGRGLPKSMSLCCRASPSHAAAWSPWTWMQGSWPHRRTKRSPKPLKCNGFRAC